MDGFEFSLSQGETYVEVRGNGLEEQEEELLPRQ